MNKCRHDSCDRSVVAKGLCLMHYKRVWRHGDDRIRYPRRPVIDRFIEKVIPSSGCWIWNGAFCAKGYGAFYGQDKKRQSAHRASYELFVGGIPDGLCVLHRCDNPACIRPSHLFLGTIADNNKDMAQKGRMAYPHAMIAARRIQLQKLKNKVNQ